MAAAFTTAVRTGLPEATVVSPSPPSSPSGGGVSLREVGPDSVTLVSGVATAWSVPSAPPTSPTSKLFRYSDTFLTRFSGRGVDFFLVNFLFGRFLLLLGLPRGPSVGSESSPLVRLGCVAGLSSYRNSFSTELARLSRQEPLLLPAPSSCSNQSADRRKSANMAFFPSFMPCSVSKLFAKPIPLSPEDGACWCDRPGSAGG